MRRVHVIGGPGSGKTTLARQLAQRLDAPVFDLDEVAYAGGAGMPRPLALRMADVAASAAGPAWITEGIYLWWIDDLLRAADTIVWLDIPWRTAAWRICLRHVRATVAGTNRHPGLLKLVRFLGYTRRYYVDASLCPPAAPDADSTVTRAHTERSLAPYRAKVVRCAASSDVAAFLRAAS
ncbi:MAG TPA: shikimate kinase [Chloroflexota bacterium]